MQASGQLSGLSECPSQHLALRAPQRSDQSSPLCRYRKEHWMSWASRHEPVAFDEAFRSRAEHVDHVAAPPRDALALRALPSQIAKLLGIGIEVKELLVAVAGEPDVLLMTVGQPVDRLAERGVLAVEV